MRPLKWLAAKYYKNRLSGWTTVADLYRRGRAMSWVKLPFLHEVATQAILSEGGAILECGSGLTTQILRRHARGPVVSLEQHKGWAMKTGAIHAPIDWNTGWYRGDPYRDFHFYGLVVVDGPDGGDRAGYLHGASLKPGCTVVIDDTHNYWEGWRVVEATAKLYPSATWQVHGDDSYSYTVVKL